MPVDEDHRDVVLELLEELGVLLDVQQDELERCPTLDARLDTLQDDLGLVAEVAVLLGVDLDPDHARAAG